MAVGSYAPAADKIVHTTKVDFTRRNTVEPHVKLVQYDNRMPILSVALYKDNAPYRVPSGYDVNIRVGKKGGKYVLNPAVGANADKSVVFFEITQAMTTDWGKIPVVIELINGGTVAGSSTIAFDIDRNPAQQGDIESSSEGKALFDYVNEAKQSASDASAAKAGAEAAASRANTYQQQAASSASSAQTSASNAETFKNAASKSATDAATANTEAQKAKDTATQKATDASTSAAAAAKSATDAAEDKKTVADNLATVQDLAEEVAANKASVDSSASDAAASEANAKKYADTATQKAAEADASKTEATTQAAAAANSAQAAAASQSKVSESEANVEEMVTTVEGYKTAAEASAEAAKGSEDLVAGYSESAEASMNSAKTYADTATTKAAEADASKAEATKQATNAANSAKAASDSQGVATQKASEASASASAAAESESAAEADRAEVEKNLETVTGLAEEVSTNASTVAANTAKTTASEAKAKEYADTATTKAAEAEASKTEATERATAAAASAQSASDSESVATQKASEALSSANDAATSASQVATDRAAVESSLAEVTELADQVAADRETVGANTAKTTASEENAKTYSDAAKNAQTAIESHLEEAEALVTETASYIQDAKDAATSASASAVEAASSLEKVKEYETSGELWAKKAQSYAVGDTELRPEEVTDNSKYYYEQTRSLVNSLTSALKPMGNITFAELNAKTNAGEGELYNVTDAFTSNEKFTDGGGKHYPEGSDVFYTADGQWNVVQGSGVSGVKGSSESVYRKGQVDISKENIGLGSVDNTPDAEKNVATAGKVRNALTITNGDNSVKFDGSAAGSINIPVVTKASLGLENVDNTHDVGKIVKAAKQLISQLDDYPNLNVVLKENSTATFLQITGITNEEYDRIDFIFSKQDKKVSYNTAKNGSTIDSGTFYTTLNKPTANDVGALGKTEKAASAIIADSANKVNHKLTFAGDITGEFDGSADKTVTINKTAIGLGNVDNTHDNVKNVAHAVTADTATTANDPTKLPLTGGSVSGRIIGNVSALHYNTALSVNPGYYKISINKYDSWMLVFTIRLYQAYKFLDIVISGYNFIAQDRWHAAAAVIEGSTGIDNIIVTFGKNETGHLWVAIPSEQYTGLDIYNVLSAFIDPIKDYSNLFTIEHVESLPTEGVINVRAYAPLSSNAQAVSAAKVANKLTLAVNGTNTDYDGSGAKTVTINATTVGALPATGKANSATVADKVGHILTAGTKTFDGSAAVTLNAADVGALGKSEKAATAGVADSANKVANKLTLTVNTTATEYDGSSPKTVSITPITIGALASGGTAVAANKVTHKLTAGTKSFDGSGDIAITADDVGALSKTAKAASAITADSANKVAHTLTVTDGSNVKKFDGSANVDISIEGGGVVLSAEEPDNTRVLWIDTSNNNIPKYYDTTWKPLTAVWS